MKKSFLLFLVYSFNIVNSSDNSNKLSTSSDPRKPQEEFFCRVHLEPKDPNEICPSPTQIGSFDNLLKTISDFVNGKNETKVTISSFNYDDKKMVRVITMRHDETPIIVTYIAKNIYNNPLFKESSIWRAEREPIATQIKDILDTSDETIFSNEELNVLEMILNAKVTACFHPEDSSSHNDDEQDLIPAPAPMKKVPSRATRSSESYQEAIPEIPPLTQYWGQPYYPKEFLNTASPEPKNPNIK